MSAIQLLICWCVYHMMICCKITEYTEQIGHDVFSTIPTVHKILCDGEFLPFHDDTFDLVTSNLRLVKLSFLT